MLRSPRRPLALALVALGLAAPAARAQTEPDTSRTEAEESVLESLGDDEGAGETLTLDLDDLRVRPLDLNAASPAELAVIPAFSALLVERIVAYRRAHDGFRSLPELRQVEGVTERVYDEARPFLTLGPALDTPDARGRVSPYPAVPTLRQIRADLSGEAVQRVGRRLGTSRGDTSVYLGSPDRLYTRLRVASRRRFVATIAFDKDAGEPFRFHPESNTYGYDHIAASAAVTDFGRVRRAVVGDYTVSLGQGLLLWRAGGYGKGRDATRGVARFGQGLQAFSSTEENRFFRGAGASVAITPRLTATAFASRRTLDATLADEDSTGLGTATSFGTSGLHRTAGEIARKDALGQTAGGGALAYRFRRAELGVAGFVAAFDRAVDPGPDAYRRFAFRGDRYAGGSVYGHAFTGPALLFAEVAANDSLRLGATGGVQVGLGRAGEFVLAARSFDRAFVSLNGEAFGERSGPPVGEQGVYAGVRFNASPAVLVTAYADVYRFPWLRYGVARPSAGLDLLGSVTHTVRRYLSYSVLVRSETRDEGVSDTTALGQIYATTTPETRESARLHGEYQFSRRLTLRARVEAVRFRRDGRPWQTGVVLFQDVRLEPVRNLVLEGRLALFDTDGYDARVYAYEYDVRGGFSVPALSGRGTRAYLLARYRLLDDRLTVEARAAQTRYEDVASVGSGYDVVAGNRSRDVRVQLTARF